MNNKLERYRELFAEVEDKKQRAERLYEKLQWSVEIQYWLQMNGVDPDTVDRLAFEPSKLDSEERPVLLHCLFPRYRNKSYDVAAEYGCVNVIVLKCRTRVLLPLFVPTILKSTWETMLARFRRHQQFNLDASKPE